MVLRNRNLPVISMFGLIARQNFETMGLVISREIGLKPFVSNETVSTD